MRPCGVGDRETWRFGADLQRAPRLAATPQNFLLMMFGTTYGRSTF